MHVGITVKGAGASPLAQLMLWTAGVRRGSMLTIHRARLLSAFHGNHECTAALSAGAMAAPATAPQMGPTQTVTNTPLYTTLFYTPAWQVLIASSVYQPGR